MINISFIGFGNMAKAIAGQLQKVKGFSLSAAAPSLTPGINKDYIRTHYDNKEIIQGADVIILAVKPKHMMSVLEEISPFLPPHCLLISVAAGLSLNWYQKALKPNQAMIRTMPNTPASIALAVTPMIANAATTAEHKKLAALIFSQIGKTTWVLHEEDMDTFTALSGSGPAYVFSFIEAMIEAAVALGIDASVAKTFAIQTCKGAVCLAEQSSLSLEQLRTEVTSPGGTTAAGLEVLHEPLKKLIYQTINAATQRAHELGLEYPL